MIEAIIFILSILAALLAVGLLRERKLRLALAVLLRRLLERWRNADANPVDGDERVHHGGSRRL